MARITIEDCLQEVNNRFALVHLAAKRVKQLLKGDKTLVQADNREVVMALREIAAGKSSFLFSGFFLRTFHLIFTCIE
jgi:DNA-directed RNA polymerase subunit omega